MNQIKRRHHFVPVSLLSGFTKKGTKNSTLWVFNQETGRQIESKPSSIGYEKDLYSIDMQGMAKDDLENAFMEIETKVAPIIRKIQETLVMPIGEDYEILMYFIALQYSRTPNRKDRFSEPMEQISKIIMQMSVSSKKRYEAMIQDVKKAGKGSIDTPYEDMHDFVMNENNYKIHIDNTTKMGNMLTVVHSIYRPLMDRNWSVVFCPPTIGDFICSDNPVDLHWTTLDKRPAFFDSPGHGLKETEVSIPISSRVMLLGRFDNCHPSSGKVPNKKLLATLNSFTGIGAKRFIFSRKKDFYWLTKEGKVANVEDFKRMIDCMNTK
jgi:hypothetical protein